MREVERQEVSRELAAVEPVRESGVEAGSTLWSCSRCPESPGGGTTRSFPGLSWVCLGGGWWLS